MPWLAERSDGSTGLYAALTFDVDAESGWVGSFGEAGPTPLSRGRYGITEGVPRILSLLSHFGITATFFVPGDTAERHPSTLHDILDAGHEVGHHGYLHEEPSRQTESQEREAIEKGLRALEVVAGVTPRGYRAPSWEPSGRTMGLLAEYGFEYDSSELGADRPYLPAGDDHRPLRNTGGVPIVELPGAWELCDSSLFLFSFTPTYMAGNVTGAHAAEIWSDELDGMLASDDGSLFLLTMHPEQIGRHHRMKALTTVVRRALERGVEFTSLGAVADASRPLLTARALESA